MTRRILVADDDPDIRDVIRFALEAADFDCIEARDGAEALARFAAAAPDLVVLDIGMPERDGLEVCRAIRRAGDTPILFLTARDEEVDRVLGLEMGGDDYVTKPFSPRELVARVRAVLRRRGPGAEEAGGLRRGALALDPGAHAASLGAEAIALTAREFRILEALLRNPARVLTRAEIRAVAHGGVHVSDRTIDSHVRNIRAKLAAAGAPAAIRTVHGVGFAIGDCGAEP